MSTGKQVGAGCGCALFAAFLLFLCGGGGFFGFAWFSHEFLEFRPPWNTGDQVIIIAPFVGLAAALLGGLVSFVAGFLAAPRFLGD
ncbi:MAG: hypothetical protein AAFV53_32335 [Myxococcota bacterium]